MRKDGIDFWLRSYGFLPPRWRHTQTCRLCTDCWRELEDRGRVGAEGGGGWLTDRLTVLFVCVQPDRLHQAAQSVHSSTPHQICSVTQVHRHRWPKLSNLLISLETKLNNTPSLAPLRHRGVSVHLCPFKITGLHLQPEDKWKWAPQSVWSVSRLRVSLPSHCCLCRSGVAALLHSTLCFTLIIRSSVTSGRERRFRPRASIKDGNPFTRRYYGAEARLLCRAAYWLALIHSCPSLSDRPLDALAGPGEPSSAP